MIEMFEDSKAVIIARKLKNDEQYKGQKKKDKRTKHYTEN
jgi:hypothetical protein